ncbi:MFS transporter [Frateuria defendens]|uniref:MFS transporter n=1 Tax=Frateuria defendens TaxID=2219559 RepID=UPI00066FE6B9|nr:MFS transporter [Frateuria defendens]
MVQPPDTAADRHLRLVALLVAGTFFMENLDATVITTALPAMAASFGVAPARLSIGISAYMLTLAVCIPLSGWMAERYGARRVFAGAIVLFTGASLLCGLAGGLWSFTAARVLQGVGGAMMVPVGRLLVLRRTPKRELVRAIAILTWPGLVAPILGPPLGGLISSWLGWHWIFFLNLPLGLAALALALWLVRGEGEPTGAFDLVGFVWTALACGMSMTAVELASRTPVDAPLVAALAGLGLAAGALALCHLRRAAQPLIDLSALRIPTFAAVIGGGSLFRIAIGSAPFLLPLLFQLAFGMSATSSGLLMLALFAGNLAMKPATGWAMRRFGLRGVLVGNGLLVAAGFLACMAFGAGTPPALIAAVLFATGLTRSMQFTALNTIGFADVPPARMGGATTLFSMAQQINSGLGIACGALALKLAGLLRHHDGSHLDATDFRLAFAAMALLALLALLDAARLPRDAGAAVNGRIAGESRG